MRKCQIYDTTLRDGLQAGYEIRLSDAITLATMLDEMGVSFIEAGFVSASQGQFERIKALAKLPLQTAKVTAFGRTRGKSEKAETATDLQAILSSGVKFATLVGKSRLKEDVHLSLQTTGETNLAMIRESISYLRQKGLKIIFDAEHFFDAVLKDDSDYAFGVFATALEAGCETVVLCDTNGSATSESVRAIFEKISRNYPLNRFGVHFHNDRGRAVINTETAAAMGVEHLQVTIAGYGERCGNCDLCVLLPNLLLDHEIQGFKDIAAYSRLVSLAEQTALMLTANIGEHHPWIGPNAFRSKAGMHASGEMRNPGSYLHADPALVGNAASLQLSDQSGRANLVAKVAELGFELTESEFSKLVSEYNRLVDDGYSFAGADASVFLMIQRSRGIDHLGQLFDHISRHVLDMTIKDQPYVEAVVDANLRDMHVKHVCSGHGPVQALDGALRKVLGHFYKALPEFRLVNFQVRDIEPGSGTAAKVRVHITTRSCQGEWTTVGVSTDVIEAAWIALLDSVAYMVFRNKSKTT